MKVNDRIISLDREELIGEDILSLPGGGISLLNGNRSFMALIKEVDRNNKVVTLEIEGKSYHVQIETPLDIQLRSMGFGSSAGKVLKDIKAPMPGMVLEVNVTEGTSVEPGTKLLVLEAMKMENVIIIPNAGKIKKILVKKGDAVQKNQVLIELDNG